MQEEQLEQAVSNAAAETDAKLVQEMQQREESLSSALLEARASLGNMQRLHQASQNQLFTIQSQTEEQEVRQHAVACCLHQTLLHVCCKLETAIWTQQILVLSMKGPIPHMSS